MAAASKMLNNMIYPYRHYGLSMGTMICGSDAKLGCQLYYQDNDGTRLQHHMFSVGSGATYAYGILDSGYRWDMTKEEAIELAKRAIFHATHRDAYSGGIINCYSMDENGWVKEYSGDMNGIYYGEFLEEKKRAKAEKMQTE